MALERFAHVATCLSLTHADFADCNYDDSAHPARPYPYHHCTINEGHTEETTLKTSRDKLCYCATLRLRLPLGVSLAKARVSINRAKCPTKGGGGDDNVNAFQFPH